MIYVVIAFFFGLAGGVVGKLKGSSFLLWFLISGLLPVAGLLTALAYRDEHDEPVRPCPRCRRRVKLHDAICTRCGLELEYPGTEATAPPGALAAPAGGR